MNNPTENAHIVEVAVAVIQRPDNTFLLAQRPPGKIWPGYWEFPGGKIEFGETPYHALVRELREELGIEVKTACPWVTREFVYPHAKVRLSFFRVTEWKGEPHPHEGQKLSWQTASKVSVTPVLPANVPIFRVLELPEVYAISNVHELGEQEFMRRLGIALQNGLKLVQLREKHLSRADIRGLALRMLTLMSRRGARLILNADIELAKEVGAAGVQLAGAQLAELGERPDLEWCAASCHNAEELHRAVALGCDFALLSPVLATQTHPGAPYLGWNNFAKIVAGTSIPVYALGGLSRDDMPIARQHGAHGLAMLRQAW